MKAVVVTDQQQQQQLTPEDDTSPELTCNSDLVRSYDVLKAVPMGHKGKFYQRILSEQRQAQSLPNSLHGDAEHTGGITGNNSAVELVGDEAKIMGSLEQNGENEIVAGQEVWFNTWPERCEKGENGKTSPRSYNNTIASKTCDSRSHQSRKVSLNEALKNISLAYSPVTKKLHLIAKNTHENLNLNKSEQTEQLIKNTREEKSCEATNNEAPKKTHRRIQAGSFSSTISSISDVSPSGSLLDTDTDNVSDCSDITFTRSKKKGLMQFFNRNVFSTWKSSSSTSGVWNLFNKASSDVNLTVESPKHEAIVASSSALIQLKRPSNLPAKTVEEEQKHRDEYEAMIVAAKRKEALHSVARQKQQKLQLQLEEQQAAAAKHFLENVLPNWDANQKLRKTLDLWWLGLPSSVRGQVWRKAIGNDLNITPQLYEICLARAQHLLHSDNLKSALYNQNNSGGNAAPWGTPDHIHDLVTSRSCSRKNSYLYNTSDNVINDSNESLDYSRNNRGPTVQPCGAPCGAPSAACGFNEDRSLFESLEYSRNNSGCEARSPFESFEYSRNNSGPSIQPCGAPGGMNEARSSFESLDYSRKSSGSSIHPCETSSARSRRLASRSSSLASEFVVLSVDQQLQANLAAVQLDIARVFPNLCIFQEGGPYSDVLHSLLAAYVCYRPDIGYVQGMAYLAAILTLNLHPTDAFVAFANILNRPLHLAAYTLDQRALSARYRAFERCLAAQLPKLRAHMAAADLTPDLYLLDWVYTVYAKAMPLDVASRVWDVWLRDGGEEFVFRTALGILHLYQEQLLTMDFLHGSQFLTRLPEDLSSDQLFRSIRLVGTNIGKQTFAQIVHAFSQTNQNSS